METLELAAVLSLWEMHDRGPRDVANDRRAKMQQLLRQKQKQPTFDFDIRLDELHMVLPRPLLKSEHAYNKSYRELKER